MTGENVATTLVVSLTVTGQSAVPGQETPEPLQPTKVYPVPGVALKVTTEPVSTVSLQVVPQEMPAGVEVTVPLPPAVLTESVAVVLLRLNEAWIA